MSAKLLGTLHDGREVYSDSPRPLIAALELGHGVLHNGAAPRNGHAIGVDDPYADVPPLNDPPPDQERSSADEKQATNNEKQNTRVPTPGERRLIVTPGSDITAHRIEWWEQDLVVAATVNLLAAREGQGKSTVAASWSARETRNGGVVLWIGTEESREHAQVPRLIAADAVMDRVVFVDLEIAEGVSGSLRFPLDLDLIEGVITRYGVTMIVLDPCKGMVPADFQGNDDVAVRQYLEPLAALCARSHVTVLGLVHFGKRESRDPGKLILGSVAWSQVARSVISIAEDPDSGNRVLTNTKANYSRHPRSVAFKITPRVVDTAEGPSELGAIEWIGDTTTDARDLLGEHRRDGDDEFDERDYTDDLRSSWLYRFLADAYAAQQDVRPKDAVALGADKGISRASVFRLFDKLANAGMAESVSGTDFPRVTYWRVVVEETIETAEATTRGAESAETAETTAPDRRKSSDTTAPLWGDGETTAETTKKTMLDQAQHGDKRRTKPPVVSVVSPPAHVNLPPPPGGVTARTPGVTDRVAAALAKASQQTNGQAAS